jgi:hypothetical protein
MDARIIKAAKTKSFGFQSKTALRIRFHCFRVPAERPQIKCFGVAPIILFNALLVKAAQCIFGICMKQCTPGTWNGYETIIKP